MKLTFHIGKCCGIKTIYGFHDSPTSMLPALRAIKENNADADGGHVGSKTRFFHHEAPRETMLQRLDRYLDYVRKRRPQSIVEVVLAEYNSIYGYNCFIYKQYKVWGPILEQRGFVEINSHSNSNSSNVIHIFHLNVGARKKPGEYWHPSNQKVTTRPPPWSRPEAQVETVIEETANQFNPERIVV